MKFLFVNTKLPVKILRFQTVHVRLVPHCWPIRKVISHTSTSGWTWVLIKGLGNFAIDTATEYTELATVAFWRTFHLRVKLAQGEGGECTPTPFYYIYHHQ